MAPRVVAVVLLGELLVSSKKNNVKYYTIMALVIYDNAFTRAIFYAVLVIGIIVLCHLVLDAEVLFLCSMLDGVPIRLKMSSDGMQCFY